MGVEEGVRRPPEMSRFHISISLPRKLDAAMVEAVYWLSADVLIGGQAIEVMEIYEEDGELVLVPGSCVRGVCMEGLVGWTDGNEGE